MPDRQPIVTHPTPYDPEYYSREAGDNLHSTFGQSMGATLERADTAFGNVFAPGALLKSRTLDDLEANGGRKLDPIELNKLYPDMDQPFNAPMTHLQADFLAEESKRRKNLDYLIAKGPEGTFYGAARFGASILAHAMDPLEFGATYFSGPVAEIAGSAAGVGFLASKAPSLAQSVAREVVKDTAVNIGQEALVYKQNRRELQNYDLTDSAENIGVGVLASVGLTYGAGKISKFLERSPKTADMVKKSAVGQLMQDKKVDVMPLVKDNLSETMPKKKLLQNMEVPTNFRNLPEAELRKLNGFFDQWRAEEKPYYHGSPKNMGDFKTIQKSVIESDFGKGVYLTDSPQVANGFAASKVSDIDGKVFELRIKDANLIDLDAKADAHLTGVVSPYLDEALGGKAAKELLETGNGASVMEALREAVDNGLLPEDTFDTINKLLKENGFDGTSRTGGKFMGEEGDPHNIVHLFDPEGTGAALEKVSETGQFAPNRDVIPQPTRDQALKLAEERKAPQSDFFFDEQAYKAFNEAMNETPKTLDVPALKLKEAEVLENVRSLKEQGLITEDMAAELESIQQAAKDFETTDQIAKLAMYCIGRGA